MAETQKQMSMVKAPEKRSYKKMIRMEVEPVKGANGGHIVQHHYGSDGMSMRQPEKHVFSKEDGANGTTAAHIMKHLGLKAAQPAEPEEEEANNEMAQQEQEA